MTRSGSKKPTRATWDHLTPKSRGGTDAPENKVRACFKCNNEKGDMTETEYLEFLTDRRAAKKASR